MAESKSDSGPGRIALEGVNAFQQASWRMAAQVSRGIDILSHDLEARLYDQQPFLAAVKQLAIHSRFSRIRILLQSNEKVRQQGHRLVQLANRLPSRIEIRRPHPDYIDLPENFLIADVSGYIRRHRSNGYQGEADYRNRLQATQLSRLFNEIWERSEVDSTLRHLHL
jgi:hypothetical protein